MRTSSIRLRANARLAILHEDFLEICDGNMLAAMLLSILVYWTDVKVAKKDENLWVWKSHEDFQEDLMFDKPGMKPPHRTTIKAALDLLVSKKFLQWRRNPKMPLDQTRQYLVEQETVQSAIDALSPIVVKPTMQSLIYDNATLESQQSLSENQQCNDEIPTSNTNDYSTEITNRDYDTEREGVADATAPAASSSFHFPQNDEERQQYDDFMCNAHKEVAKANNGTRHSKTIKATISKRTPAKKETPPAISAEAIRIMDAWDSIFSRKCTRTENHIKAAELLVPCAPTRDDLSNIRKFCYKSNPKWYNDKGVSLIDVAKNFDKWQSLQEAPQVSENNGHSPSSNGAKPRPSALVSEEQAAKNKARLYAAAAAKQAEKAGGQ